MSQPQHTHSDCRTIEGELVGLLDGMLAAGRLVARHLDSPDPAVQAALTDFRSDESIRDILGTAPTARFRPCFIYRHGVADFWARGWQRSTWRWAGSDKRHKVRARYCLAHERQANLYRSHKGSIYGPGDPITAKFRTWFDRPYGDMMGQEPALVHMLELAFRAGWNFGTSPQEPAPEKVVEPTVGTIPCPKCGEGSDSFDHTGILCHTCAIFFDSECPGDETLAMLSDDPVHREWIERIQRAGWTTGTPVEKTQRHTADAVPFENLPADHPAMKPPAPRRRKLPPVPRIVWECPDCGWCNDRALTVEDARAQIALARPPAASACQCPNLRQKQP